MSDKECFELLLGAYLKMVAMHSCEVGEKSHMLAHHTEFIKRQVNEILKRQARTALEEEK